MAIDEFHHVSADTDNRLGDLLRGTQERIKNVAKKPTYLMAPVHIQRAWKCYNMNPQKFELILHIFFGKSCLELDVFDEKGKRHTPCEWFIAPLEVIEQVVELIINGKIVNYQAEYLFALHFAA